MAVIQGTPFDDTLLGTLGNDFIYGWQGNDLLNGAQGDNILYGDEGNDSLTGGNGNDLLAGSQGDDLLEGGQGNDILYGGADDDILTGGLGSDRLFGDAGFDKFSLEWGADTVTGGKDKDTFILFPSLGGNTLAEAAIITDFNPLEDELELTGGLTFEGLNIFQGTENYANDTIIQDRNTGRYLAILLNVATPSFVQEATGDIPREETAVPAQAATEAPLITFAGPSLGISPTTLPGNQPDDTLPGNQPDDTLPGNQPDDTLPGNQPDDTLPGNQPDDTLPGNQAPTNIILSNISIAENSANGAIIASLSTVDPDAEDSHTYTLIDNAGGRFTLSGNQLAVANSTLLDFETVTSHGIIVQTTDSQGNTFDKPFTISVTDVNEEMDNNAPTDIALSNSAIDENSANGTAIGTLSTTDPDAGDTHSYSLVDNAGGRFAIAGNQLTVANGALLDFETANTYNIVVRTTDAAGQTFSKTLAITVNNVNEAPTDLAVSNLIIAENSANGSLIGTITPTDPDTTDTHTYTLLDNAGGRFALSANQLIVADGSLLDYETATLHNITLRTTDAGGNNFDKAFTVTVSDVNETIPNNAPTDISVSNMTIAENSTNGTILGDLATVDPDAGDTHSYSLVDNAGGRFAISGTQITVADSTLLDYEVNPTHSITVRTTDAGGLTFDKPFTITVVNVNEAPTDMGVSNTVVNENSSNGTAIGTITTTDPDTADTYTYSLVDNAGGRFAISGNQLTVANGTLLDYETGTSHPIILRSTDAGGLSIDKNFIITLNNVNDPPLLVMNSPLSVTQRGIAQITNSLLQVTDQDNTPGQLTYTLVNAPPNGQLRLGSTPLFVNDTFTQADIDSNGLTYTHGLIQLTNNSRRDDAPQISGSNVVWQGSDGTDNEIYFYDGNSTTQLTNNSIDDEFTQISGSNVVWQASNGTDYEIYFYDGTSITHLTNNSAYDAYPQLSGSNVVWQGYDGIDNEIYFYDGNSTTQLSNNSSHDYSPQISGSNVVWPGYDGTDYQIYFYDGNSTTQLINTSLDDYAPQVSGANVVWHGWDGTDTEIYFYDGNSTTQLTNNSTDDLSSQISGSNMVWYGWDGTDYEIYFYDGNNATTTQLTNNSTEDCNPQISGSNVVWQGYDGTDYEIYLYDGNSSTQLTNNSMDDEFPQISGSNVVWQGSDGTDTEIYLSPMGGALMSDSLMFTVSDGIGGVLGATSFNVNVI